MTEERAAARRAEATAEAIRARYKPGDAFATAYHGWAGTPWRPGDTDVAFKRCWAEGEVLHLETSAPYQGMETSLRVSVHAPGGEIVVGPGLKIASAQRVVVGAAVGLPGNGPAFEAR